MNKVERVIPEEVIKLINEGYAEVYGGVVRYINSGSKNGKIIKHLNFTDIDSDNEILNELSKFRKEFNGVTEIFKNIQNINNIVGKLNLVMSGVNLCVDSVGFIVVINKLNKINKQLKIIDSNTSILIDNEIDKLRNNVRKDIDEAMIFVNIEKQFPDEGINKKEARELDKIISNLIRDIRNLVNKRKQKISLKDEEIIELYQIYLLLNKLKIYKNRKNTNYTKEIHKENIRDIKEITDIVKENVIKNYIYKEMYLSPKNIFSFKEIKRTTELFCNICDYNVELIDTQLLVIEPPSIAEKAINKYIFDFGIKKLKKKETCKMLK